MLNRCNKRKSKEDYMRIALRGLRSFSRSIMKYALIYEAKWCEQIREEYISFDSNGVLFADVIYVIYLKSQILEISNLVNKCNTYLKFPNQNILSFFPFLHMAIYKIKPLKQISSLIYLSFNILIYRFYKQML